MPSPARGEGARGSNAARGDTPRCGIHVFTCQTALGVPAAHLRPGRELVPNPMRGGRSADRRTDAALRIRWACDDAACQALARRLASNNVGRSPLGAPPWRFLGSGSALPSAAFPPQRVQRAPRGAGRSAWRSVPVPPEHAVTSRTAGRHTSLRPQDRLRRRPSMSKAGGFYIRCVM
jgi:hypothetical protein